MIKEEALKILEEFGGCCSSDDEYKAAQIAIDALKKQMSYKPTNIEKDVMCDVFGDCICGADVNWQYGYCPRCGQKLDWRDYGVVRN